MTLVARVLLFTLADNGGLYAVVISSAGVVVSNDLGCFLILLCVLGAAVFWLFSFLALSCCCCLLLALLPL